MYFRLRIPFPSKTSDDKKHLFASCSVVLNVFTKSTVHLKVTPNIFMLLFCLILLIKRNLIRVSSFEYV